MCGVAQSGCGALGQLLTDCTRIGQVLVGDHQTWRASAAHEGVGKERLDTGEISPTPQEHVHHLVVFVDGATAMGPGATNPDVRFRRTSRQSQNTTTLQLHGLISPILSQVTVWLPKCCTS
jgi:hypothetical protein